MVRLAGSVLVPFLFAGCYIPPDTPTIAATRPVSVAIMPPIDPTEPPATVRARLTGYLDGWHGVSVRDRGDAVVERLAWRAIDHAASQVEADLRRLLGLVRLARREVRDPQAQLRLSVLALVPEPEPGPALAAGRARALALDRDDLDGLQESLGPWIERQRLGLGHQGPRLA